MDQTGQQEVGTHPALPTRLDFFTTTLQPATPEDLSRLAEGNQDGDSCPICYQVFTDPAKTPCGHIYCRECLEAWLEGTNNCPTCRSLLIAQALIEPQPNVIAEIEALDLDFEVDQQAVMRELHAFDDLVGSTLDAIYEQFPVDEQTKIYIDYASLLPKAVAAGLLMKPERQSPDDHPDNFCRREWVWALTELRNTLQQRNGMVYRAGEFGRNLEMWVASYVDWQVQRETTFARAEYGMGFTNGKTFAKDVKLVESYVIWCAAKEHERRVPPTVFEPW
ncbi:hypothetical protein KC343_g10224 [Hortaea werneckii]|uniref:RING-type domain-containing protein n=1 Tax=Hortaea werneckii TaxID=91943 RepID=A0A3M7FKN1_HORWE|nr:hypothetical protein KC352_g19089 [Hortaea werneckii]KAI7559351.1 hypothetical protein KC317_g10417 [Hortaea werneckii]KAI7607360.1 hypothetical protein KC346_g10108 [Hortaea werneckii]KAI7615178.1 hypothetical protein KC343_g10224 [Hortaea werneckii]KAI7655222.1 hypothetical protein KC319_g10066 [Hortaea werneckii]